VLIAVERLLINDVMHRPGRCVHYLCDSLGRPN